MMLDFRKTLPAWLFDLTDGLLAVCGEVYLVGGAVRNLLSGLTVDDYDFVVRENAIQGARRAADLLKGKFYVLDHQRQTARALIPAGQSTIKLDFALFNGQNLEEDLRARDFTVNAMALRLPVEEMIIDPTGGQDDLRDQKLRPCSETSFVDDPVRTIRFVRFQQEIGLNPEPEVNALVKKAAAALGQVSGERQRDALIDVIRVSDLRAAFNEMADLGIAAQLFPETAGLKAVALTAPHIHNGWDHTMQVMHYCQQIMAAYGLAPALPNLHPRIGQALTRLKPYQEGLINFFNTPISAVRSKYQLLILSALFHDSAKAVVDHEFNGERKKFPGHAREGAKLVKEWASAKGFSKKETDTLFRIVRNHMKVSKPNIFDANQKRLGVYHFFNRSGQAGILTAILHLADVLTTYEDGLTDARWNEAMTAVDHLFDAFFFHYEEWIDPPLLLNGDALMKQFNLPPGEQVGYLLKALQEAQVTGEVTDVDQAIDYLRPLASGMKG